MTLFQGIVDIAMSEDGDLVIEKGDLKLHNGINWLISEIQKILKTCNPEWRIHPNVGVGLDEFIGQPNNREVGKFIERKIREKIKAEGLDYPGDVDVQVVPISVSDIMIYINLKIGEQNIFLSKVIYDYSKGLITQSAETMVPEAENPQINRAPSNPYLSRIR